MTPPGLIVRVVALTIVHFLCFAIAGGIVMQGQQSAASGSAGGAVATLLVVSFLNTIVLTRLILRSRWSGGRLIATVAVVFYGVFTLMSQMESVVFLTRLPVGMAPRLFLMGALVVIPFSLIAVPLLGKRTAWSADREPNRRLIMPAHDWAWRAAAIALVYAAVYFTFGYYVAWRNPAVLEYYGGVDEGTFLAHMRTVMRTTAWLIPFQLLRGLLWMALALPVVRMMKGSRAEAALTIGLLFSVVMNAQILLPNPYMPDAVRMAHLLETASSNLLFGCLVGWLLSPEARYLTTRGLTGAGGVVSGPASLNTMPRE